MYLFQLINLRNLIIIVIHLHSTMYLFQPLRPTVVFKVIPLFTFHYVSISTAYSYFLAVNLNYLHSTMYLFQPSSITKLNPITLIYIPLCIYFNLPCQKFCKGLLLIYIPLCIYFNPANFAILASTALFTFHYVSISTYKE